MFYVYQSIFQVRIEVYNILELFRHPLLRRLEDPVNKDHPAFKDLTIMGELMDRRQRPPYLIDAVLDAGMHSLFT